MTSVGELLRKAREKQEKPLSEIAGELCLTQSYLRAIEADDLDSLPGYFFYRSFVKQYAATLGLDFASLSPALDALAPRTETPEEAAANGASRKNGVDPSGIRQLDPLVEHTNRPYFSGIRTRWSFTMLALVLAGCTGFYAWWSRPVEAAQPAATSNAALSQTLRPTAPAADQIPATSATPAEVEAAEPVQAPVVATTVPVPAGVLPEAAAPEPPVREASAIELSLSATERTWLSITTNGRQVFSGVLQPSESKTLSGFEAAILKIGNAAGLEIRWNGKPIGPIGPRGEVRTVRLSRGNYEIVAPSSSL